MLRYENSHFKLKRLQDVNDHEGLSGHYKC